LVFADFFLFVHFVAAPFTYLGLEKGTQESLNETQAVKSSRTLLNEFFNMLFKEEKKKQFFLWPLDDFRHNTALSALPRQKRVCHKITRGDTK